jgi:hypothetical protein
MSHANPATSVDLPARLPGAHDNAHGERQQYPIFNKDCPISKGRGKYAAASAESQRDSVPQPGVAERSGATPGKPVRAQTINPERVASGHARPPEGRNPFRVLRIHAAFPGVGPRSSGQPRAGRRNPFGVFPGGNATSAESQRDSGPQPGVAERSGATPGTRPHANRQP